MPIFLAANVIVDIEVLFAGGWPQHRHWHFHTLLIGGLVGAAMGLAVYLVKPVRAGLERAMKTIRLPYKAGPIKAAVSGALGVWLHVLIDSL